jgi:xylulokinase
MIYVIGVDIGTSSIKAVLYDEKLKKVCSVKKEYKLEMNRANYVEMDMNVYLDSFSDCIRLLVKDSKINPNNILAICMSCQGETFVPVDINGNPLRKAIVWLDNRSVKQAENMKEKFDKKTVHEITGQCEILPTWASTKMLWLKENEPDVFKKTWKFAFIEDYIIYKSTGLMVCEPSLYSSSLLINVTKRHWWKEMLDFIGIDENLLPEIVEPGQEAANINSAFASLTGLNNSTKIIMGGLDQACACLGCGNYKAGIISENTGSSLNVCVTLDEFTTKYGLEIPIHYHVLSDKYYLLPWGQTAGMTLQWFKEAFSSQDSFDDLFASAAKSKPGANGIVCLPHLMGAQNPELDPHARAVFFNINATSTKNDFVRAILESIGYMLRRIMEGLDLKSEQVISLGGASKNELWTQVKADILNKQIITIQDDEPGCLGAAILSLKALNKINSFDDIDFKQDQAKIFFPNSENLNIYDKAYRNYVNLYSSLKDLFKSVNHE